jgi:signal peptidase II
MQKSAHPRGITFIIGIAAALTAAVVVLADRLTKHFFFSSDPNSVKRLIPNILDIVHHENHGIVANFPLPLPATIALTILVMAFIAGAAAAAVQTRRPIEAIALAEIFGGALGNLIDRLTQGFVFDWLLFFGQSAMNLADLAIIEGMVIFIGWRWMKKRRLAASG